MTDITSPPEPVDEPAGRGAATRRAVLDAAIARFARDGYRATAVTDIARDAGVGGTAAYSYFPNKEALFLAAVDEDAAAVVEESLARSVGSSHLPEWPGRALAAAIDSLDRHPLARRLLAGQEPEVAPRVMGTPALTSVRKALAEELRQGQERGQVRSDVDPQDLANGLVSIMISLLASAVQLGSRSDIHYGREITAVLRASISPPPA